MSEQPGTPKPRVFISYATASRERIGILATALEAEGFEVWWDHALSPGEDYREKFEAALSTADVVVVCWTAAAAASDWVISEADDARRRDKLVPVLLQPCTIPKPFDRLHTQPLNRWTGSRVSPGFQKLVESIRAKVEHREPRPLPWRGRLLTRGGAGVLAAGALALLVNFSGLKQLWDGLVSPAASQRSVNELSARIDAQDALVEVLVEQFVADARARGEEPDESSIDAFRRAVQDLLASGDKRKIEAVTRFSKGAKEEAFSDLETLAHEQEAVAKAQLVRSAESWKQIGALAYAAEPQRSQQAYERALTIVPNDPYALNELGRLHMRADHLEAAEAMFQRMLELPVQNNDKSWHAAAYGNLGTIALARGDLVKAEYLQKGALSVNEKLKKPGRQATSLTNLATIAALRGDLAGAETFYRRAMAIDDAIQNPGEPAFERRSVVYLAMGDLSYRKGDAAAAETFYRRSAEAGQKSGIQEREAPGLLMLGGSLSARGELDEAEDLLKRAVAIYDKSDSPRERAAALSELGGVRLKRGDTAGAQALTERARDIYQKLGDVENEANVLVNLGAIAEKKNDMKLTKKHWRSALAIYRKLGRPEQVAQMSEWLRSIGDDPDKPS